MKKAKANPKRKRLMREIERRKFPFVASIDQKTGKQTIHPLITQTK